MEHFPLNERLHTDVLEDTYGPISVKVVRHTSTIREAHIIDSKNISRTFAVTFFPKEFPNKEIEIINEEIKNGEAIGKAFKKQQYHIRKNVLDVYIISIPLHLQKAFATQSTFAKARISEFFAKKEGSEPIVYATVVEIYSPEFREAIINSTDRSQISATTTSFESLAISKNEIWKRIGNNNDYSDKQSEFEQAKKLSESAIVQLKEDIAEYLEKL